MNTLRSLAITAAAIFAYHFYVGASVVSVVVTEKELSVRQKIEWALMWPAVVGATNYMQAKYVEVMDDAISVLKELNSGKWEKRP